MSNTTLAARSGDPTTLRHPRILLIGASRGLGLAIATEYLDAGAEVTATVRGAARTPLHELATRHPDRLRIEHVDITDADQIAALRARQADRSVDLLFVNAGTTNDPSQTPADVPTAEFCHVMTTNTLGPMRVVEALGDTVAATGTIAVMSSGQGSVGRNTEGKREIYRASKAALNQLMRSYAARHRSDGRTLLLLAPGWVKTELGGPDARLTIAESIPSLVGVVEAQAGRGGLQYLDYRGETVPW